MRVLHLSSDDITGGAARCAYRLHEGLLRLGVDSSMLVKRRRSDDATVELFRPADDLPSRVRRRLRSARIRREHARYRETRDPRAEAFSDDRSPYDGLMASGVRSRDITHLHWISGFVDLPRFADRLPPDAPIVWTLHDMNAFTGGCHYASGCEAFTDRCGACPQLGSSDEVDVSRQIWRRKQRLFGQLAGSRLRIVTPSRWLASQARQSSLIRDRFRVEVIPYGLDTEELAPRDREAARSALGIPRDSKVVLFAAHSVDKRRKGIDLLVEALNRLSDDVEGLFLLSLGKGSPPLSRTIRQRHLGYVGHDRLLSVVYSAADVFALPSREDNLPATALESLACGTPIVGFGVGGVPEVVRPGETGEVAQSVDAGALGAALKDLLIHPEHLAQLRVRCRDVAAAEYTIERQARSYRALYQQTCGAELGGAAESRDRPARSRVAT